MRFLFALFAFGFLLSCGEAENSEAEAVIEEVGLDSLSESVEEEFLEEQTPVYDLSKIQFQNDFDGCLPEINPTFKRWMEEDSIAVIFGWRHGIVYKYLSTHLDSVSVKSVLAIDSIYGSGPLVWEQYFEGGIKFEYEEYLESGANTVLSTPCQDKAELIRILYPMIEEEQNSWNEDSTSYGPEEAGCYYNFRRDSVNNTLSVDWYCGC